MCLQAGGSTKGWGALLGAAFPSITSFSTTCAGTFLDVGLMHSLLTRCRHLAKLDLQYATLDPTLSAAAHLLPAWLPKVRDLRCGVQTIALVPALAPQLQHLDIQPAGNKASDSAETARMLTPCEQLESICLADLDQQVLDVLMKLVGIVLIPVDLPLFVVFAQGIMYDPAATAAFQSPFP